MKYLKIIAPHLIAVLLFALISIVYNSPLLEGKKLKSSDRDIMSAITKENSDYYKETGEIPLWTNTMFSGMPYYTVSSPILENFFIKIYNFLIISYSPFGIVFWYMLGFYILLISFRLKPWLAIAGAIGFAFSSYFYVILIAGHYTKAFAIAFIAPIFAGVYLAFERKQIFAGMLVTAFFLTMQFVTLHVQIIYYTAIIIIIYGIFELIISIIKKHFLRFVKTTLILCIAPIFALLINATSLLTTYEYTQYSLRGASELTAQKNIATSGLNKDYATAWSYGICESFSLLIPNIQGGSSHFDIGKKTNTYKVVEPYFGKNAEQITKYFPAYFGTQPFTLGTVYAGAIICFLFVLGLFIVKGKIKWILLTATILSILLALGHNFEWFTNLFLDYVPGYNKFRTVSMILVIAEFTMPLLGILAINELINKTIPIKKLKIVFPISIAIVLIPLLCFIIAPGLSGVNDNGADRDVKQLCNNILESFPNDARYDQIKQNFENDFLKAAQKDKIDLVRNSALRSLAFIILAVALIFAIIKIKKLPPFVIAAVLTILFMIDLIPIARDYLNNSDDIWKKEKKNDNTFIKTEADNYILNDKSHFRVLNLTVSPFNDGSTSAWHNSIGGYSGAKMRRYQELADTMIFKSTGELSLVQNIVYFASNSKMSLLQLQQLFSAQAKIPILSMLNTKYIILDKKMAPLENTNTLGNAWFVKKIKIVNSPDDELNALKTFEPATEAIISKQFENQIKSLDLNNIDSLATIEQTALTPNTVEYKSNSKTDCLVVFSEIYYPKGWVVTIDGNEVNHFRANYVLRSMVVPAGNHVIKFSFEPKSYFIGKIISYISLFAFLLLIVSFITWYFMKNKKIKTAK